MFKKTIKSASLLFFFAMLFTAIPLSVSAVVTGSTSTSWNVFDPSSGGQFRYGPALILYPDNSIDMWTCSPGAGAGVMDFIRYKRSTNGGTSWGAESVVLEPTPGGRDALSTCDPGVVKFGGYYYIGYTSTELSYGTDNDVYVARSTSPTGPWSKWNGSGWGGNPQPFITFTDPNTDTYGAGEPSFVVKDTTLYIYYTWSSRDPVTQLVTNQTRVRTASTTNANWPGATTYQGVSIHRAIDSDDSTDHKYVPSMNKFIAVGTSKRFTSAAFIKLYESTDGITYYPATLPKNFINVSAHNGGITGNELGQFITTQNNRVAYAYGTQWAYWYTAMNPITLTNTNLPAVPLPHAPLEGNGQVQLYFRTSGVAGETYKIKYGTTSGSYTTTLTGITGSPYTVTGLTNGTPYYFVIVGTNANGDSGNSSQLSAIPLNVSVSPRISATASTQLVGWEAAKAIDADIYTNYSSVGHATESINEWITVDTGANRMVKRVTLTPRLPQELGFTGGFNLQVSVDNTNWTNSEFKRYRLESPTRYVYILNEPLHGRYMRINTWSLGHDQQQPWNYILQLGDIKIEEIPYSAVASSETGGWPISRVLDSNANTTWSSLVHLSAVATESMYVNTGAVNKIEGVRLTAQNGGYCFPVDFKFQSSNNGTTWTDIPGASYTNYPNPGSVIQTFKFGSTVTAQYIRLYATKLSLDGFSSYYLRISDFKVDLLAKRTPTASSTTPGWEVAKAADNQTGTFWSSIGHSSANFNEWISVDMGSQQNWSGIRVKPRSLGGFPVDFSIQYSTNGTSWTQVPGQSYTAYYNPGGTEQQFPFSSLVSARYFRINATKLSPDQYSNYYLQFDEIIVDR